MRVAVIGAGIAGVTTAFEAATLGHEVTVFERHGSVASEASFAQAGLIAPGLVTPWAAPGAAVRLLRELCSPQSPTRLGGRRALAQLPWLWHWWRACRAREHAANRAALHGLAVLSRQRLLELTRALQLDYEQMPGCLVLLRTPAALKSAQPGLKLMAELGVVHELVDRQRCHALESNLSTATPLHAAIHLPQDGVGNCRQFAHLLKAQAQRLGAVFRFDTPVLAIEPGSPAAVLHGDRQRSAFDAVVLCAGASAVGLFGPLKLRLPIAAVQGYSVTAPLRHRDGYPMPGPRAAVIDGGHRVSITRLGQRIRVAGITEIGGNPAHLALAPLRTLYRLLDDWFPGAAQPGQAQHWKGAMPMLPDGPPALGASGAPGVWLNLGHGAHGWALACGSARVLAEQISGRSAPLDMARLSVQRWR